MGLLKKIKKTFNKVVGNKIVKTVFPVFSLANSKTGQSVGAGMAAGLGLGSLFGAGSGSLGLSTLAQNGGQQVYDSAIGPTLSGAPMNSNPTSSFFGSLLNGLGSSLGKAGLGLATNYLTSTYNNHLQQGFADDAFAKNLEMWHLQNAYNSPLAQMQRLRDAGLNPNLMYSQGTVGNAGAVGAYPTVNNSDMTTDGLLAFQNMANLDAQHELLAQQIELAKMQTMQKGIEVAFEPERQTAQIGAIKAGTANTNAHTVQVAQGDNLNTFAWLRNKLNAMLKNGSFVEARNKYGLKLRDRGKGVDPNDWSWFGKF